MEQNRKNKNTYGQPTSTMVPMVHNEERMVSLINGARETK
jgi:hypothetical protein